MRRIDLIRPGCLPHDWYLGPTREIRAFVKHHPEWISEEDGPFDKNLPMHTAIHEHATLDMIQYLFETYREAIRVPGEYGWLPLHVAVACIAPYETLQYLLEKFPEATRSRDEKGNLPIHLVTDDNLNALQCFKALVQTYPESIRALGEDGTVLHRAVVLGYSFKLVKLMHPKY